MRRLSIFAFLTFMMMQSPELFALEHTVLAGDTLYSIAKQYNISVAELQASNNITDPSLLKVGMLLQIPEVPSSSINSSTTQHTVAKGDTYYNIAKRYNLTVEELLDLNQRSPEMTLRIGELLLIQKNSAPSISSQASSPPTNTPTPTKPPSPPTIWPDAGNSGRSITLPEDDEIEILDQDTKLLPHNDESHTTQAISWPIQGSIQPHSGRQGGVVISTVKDASVISVSTGTVAFIGPYRELGNIIVVERTGGYLYIYGGLDAVFVTTGQEIDVGTALGVITSNNGKIIFSVHKDANIINPSNAPRN